MDIKEMKQEISKNRESLDSIDRRIVELFEQRMHIVQEIGTLKKHADLPVLDSNREQQILMSRRSWLQNKAYETALDRLFELLMSLSRDSQQDIVEEKRQEKVLVAYQGVPGSYGHEAAKSYFGDNADYLCYEQFMDTLEAVVKGKAVYAILPIENSIAGMVYQALDVLVSYRCFICGEIVLPICHCLLGTQGSRIEDITEVHSHQQALAQCSDFFTGYPHIKQKNADNTAIAAKKIATIESTHVAAIASRECMDLYGLSLLAEGIQNRSENFTRFIIISRSEYKKIDWNKVSVRFTLTHESGSLYEMLRIPSDEQVNLTSIVSRPHPGHTFRYYFYVDMTSDTPECMERCLRRMSAESDEWVMLGHYRSADRSNTWDASI